MRIEQTGRLIVAVALAIVARAALADEVFLKSGGRVSGRVVSRTATMVEVDVGAGKIAVPASSVVRIEEVNSRDGADGRTLPRDRSAGSRPPGAYWWP